MVNKRKYTTNIHAHRLTLMLRRSDWHFHCPAGKGFEAGYVPTELWEGSEWKRGTILDPCKICRAFVGLSIENSCPCSALGQEDALKKTKEALRKHYA